MVHHDISQYQLCQRTWTAWQAVSWKMSADDPLMSTTQRSEVSAGVPPCELAICCWSLSISEPCSESSKVLFLDSSTSRGILWANTQQTIDRQPAPRPLLARFNNSGAVRLRRQTWTNGRSRSPGLDDNEIVNLDRHSYHPVLHLHSELVACQLEIAHS